MIGDLLAQKKTQSQKHKTKQKKHTHQKTPPTNFFCLFITSELNSKCFKWLLMLIPSTVLPRHHTGIGPGPSLLQKMRVQDDQL